MKFRARKHPFRALGTIVSRKFRHSPISLKIRGNTGGNSTFVTLTNGMFLMFFSPTVLQTLLYLAIPFLSDVFFALLSHEHIKHGYLVCFPCCPKSMESNFTSPHITHSWSAYLIVSKIVFMCSYVSFICTE